MAGSYSIELKLGAFVFSILFFVFGLLRGNKAEKKLNMQPKYHFVSRSFLSLHAYGAAPPFAAFMGFSIAKEIPLSLLLP